MMEEIRQKTQVVEVDRKLVLGIEWDSIQEAQEQSQFRRSKKKLQ